MVNHFSHTPFYVKKRIQSVPFVHKCLVCILIKSCIWNAGDPWVTYLVGVGPHKLDSCHKVSITCLLNLPEFSSEWDHWSRPPWDRIVQHFSYSVSESPLSTLPYFKHALHHTKENSITDPVMPKNIGLFLNSLFVKKCRKGCANQLTAALTRPIIYDKFQLGFQK